MVLFRPDGKFAFVPSSFTPEMDVIETATYKVVARVPQASPFSPNLAVDQDEVWVTLKDSGKTQVVSAKPPFQTLTVLETGPITNHVTFVTNTAGRFAYVTVGGRNEVLVYPARSRLFAEAGRDHQDRRSPARHLGLRGWTSRLRWSGKRR